MNTMIPIIVILMTSVDLPSRGVSGQSSNSINLPMEIYQGLPIPNDLICIFDQPYRHPTTRIELLEAASKCNTEDVLVGAMRSQNPLSIHLAAVGPLQVLIQKTPINQPRLHGKVNWYLTANYSFGFSYMSDIEQNRADVNDNIGQLRLSWNLDTNKGGYRVGNERNLDNSSDWRKVIYCK